MQDGRPLKAGETSADHGCVSGKRLGLGLGVLSVALELPLIGQLFFFGDVFSWGLLFFLALGVAPLLALAGLGASAGRRDFWGVAVSGLGLGGLAIPLLVVWAIVGAFQQG
jgi:hypothetical protein